MSTAPHTAPQAHRLPVLALVIVFALIVRPLKAAAIGLRAET
jgi:hypothetical protein